MSSKKKLRIKQRQQEEQLNNKTEKKPGAKKFNKALVLIILVVIAISTGFFRWGKSTSSSTSSENVNQDRDSHRPISQIVDKNKSAFAKPVDVPIKTVFMLPSELKKSPDAARMNLLCAKGLNGSEDIDVDKCLKTLDEWAAFVKHETDRHLYKYKQNPKEYHNSEAYFRMLMVITVLQQDYGIKYNLKLSSLAGKIDWDDAKDSKYVFLHGLLTGEYKGTCASMPVLYLAIGRRLGYPLKLVCARNHIFLRWEDDKERINLEATGPGLSIHSDEHYRKDFTPEDKKNKYYLKSLNPTEEYALFLEFRADIMLYNGLDEGAKRIYKKLLEYNPDNTLIQKRLREIKGNKATFALQRSEHKKTDTRRKQLASIHLINQVQPKLKLIQEKEFIALNHKYLKKIHNQHHHGAAIEDTRSLTYHQSQMFFESRVKPKMSMSEQLAHRNEVAHIKKLNSMLSHQLFLWSSQMQSGVGIPVTIDQINILLTKISRPEAESQKRYLEQQRERKYKQIKKRSPSPKREIAFLEEMEQKERWLQEEQEVRNRIRLANNQRSIEETRLEHLKIIKKVK